MSSGHAVASVAGAERAWGWWWQGVGEQAGPQCPRPALGSPPLTPDAQTANVRDPSLDRRRLNAVFEQRVPGPRLPRGPFLW